MQRRLLCCDMVSLVFTSVELKNLQKTGKYFCRMAFIILACDQGLFPFFNENRALRGTLITCESATFFSEVIEKVVCDLGILQETLK